MALFQNVNWISVAMAGVFALPLVLGMFVPFSHRKLYDSFWALLILVEIVISLAVSVLLTRAVFSYRDGEFALRLYKTIPALRNFNINIVLISVFTLVLNRAIHIPGVRFFKKVMEPASKRVYLAYLGMNTALKKIAGGLWQLPKAAGMALAFSLLLSIFAGLSPDPRLSAYLKKSAAYRFVENGILSPVLNSGLAKQIPVILRDSLKKGSEGSNPETGEVLSLTYFNGVTLDEAIKSNEAIDAAAKSIVGSESRDREKAHLIYKWIGRNIKYDKEKVAAIARNSSKVSSGAVEAFSSRRGVCFDYACLYVAMCRAVGVKVRFISGVAFDGTAWGDHAWNQVYSASEARWINVDATFGSAGFDYFDRKDFGSDHVDAEINGEW